MKNKKGFTLVELIAVIVILGIIIAIAVPSYMNIKLNIDKNNYNNKIKLIEIAGQKFAEDTNITAVFVKELIENGYLEADDKDGNIYGLDGEIINCYLVILEQKEGIFYSRLVEKDYSEKNTDNKVCDYNIPNQLSSDFKIEMYDGNLNNLLQYDSNKKWWTKNNVILKAVFKNNENNEVTWYEGYKEEEISKCNNNQSGTCVDTNDSKILYVNSNSVLQQNYTARSTDKDGNKVIARVRVYIDKIVPNFYQNHADKLNNKWTNKDIEYNIAAYDNESGLYGFFDATGTTDNCPTTFNDYSQNKKISFKSNGEKRICIIDNVGNVNETIINIEKIDKADIKCNFNVVNSPSVGAKIGNTQWYLSNTEIRLNALNIGLSGVTLGIEDGLQKNFKYNDINTYISEIIEKNEIVERKGYITNLTGKKSNCLLNIGVETSIEAPTYKTKSSTLKDFTVTFTNGSAISGIKDKETKCYRTGSDRKWNSNGTGVIGILKSDGSCYFSGLATDSNATYEAKKCIASNAGNYICSDPVTVTVTGSCNEKISKEISSSCDSYGGCNNICGGTQYATKTTVVQYTSKYNPGYSCGKNTTTTANGCSKSCGGVKTISYGDVRINHGIYFNNSRNLVYYVSNCIVNKYVSTENTNVSCPQNGVVTYTTYCSNGNNSGDCYYVNNETSCNYETLMYNNNVGQWRNTSRFMRKNNEIVGPDAEWSNTGIGWHVGTYGISGICNLAYGWVDANHQVCKDNGETYIVDLGACTGGTYNRNCNVHDWN